MVGITYEGSLVYQSLDGNEDDEEDGKYALTEHPNLKAQLETWQDIVYLDSDYYHFADDGTYYYHVLGLHSDGTVCSLGTGTYTYTWKNAWGKSVTSTRSGGTYDDVSDWKLW